MSDDEARIFVDLSHLRATPKDESLQADQNLAGGKARDTTHKRASSVWLAVINRRGENKHFFFICLSVLQRSGRKKRQ